MKWNSSMRSGQESCECAHLKAIQWLIRPWSIVSIVGKFFEDVGIRRPLKVLMTEDSLTPSSEVS
jgi:hypothetical protein